MKPFFFLFVCATVSFGGLAQVSPRQPMAPPRDTPAPIQGQLKRPERLDRPYDASKEETIKAKVTEVKELVRGPRTVIALIIDVDGEEAQVAIGTKEYLAEHKMSFSVGDGVTIKGIKNDLPLPAPYAMGQGPQAGPAPLVGGTGGEAKKSGLPTQTGKRPAANRTQGGSKPDRLRVRVREISKGGQTLTVLNSEGRFVWLPERPSEGK